METAARSLLRQLTGKNRIVSLGQVLTELNAAVHRARRENRISKTAAEQLLHFSASARHKIKLSDHDIKIVLRCLSTAKNNHAATEPPPALDSTNFPAMVSSKKAVLDADAETSMPPIRLPPTCTTPATPISPELATAPAPAPTLAIQMMNPPPPQQPQQPQTMMMPPPMPVLDANCWYRHRSGTMYFGVPPAEGVVSHGRIVHGELVGM